MDCSTPGFPVHHQTPEVVQTHVHRVSDAIQPSIPLSSPSPAFSLSQHQSFLCTDHEEGVLISPFYSLELCIQRGISFLFSFAFCFFSFFFCYGLPRKLFAFLHFFSLGMILISMSCTTSWTSIHSS